MDFDSDFLENEIEPIFINQDQPIYLRGDHNMPIGESRIIIYYSGGWG